MLKINIHAKKMYPDMLILCGAGVIFMGPNYYF